MNNNNDNKIKLNYKREEVNNVCLPQTQISYVAQRFWNSSSQQVIIQITVSNPQYYQTIICKISISGVTTWLNSYAYRFERNFRFPKFAGMLPFK